MHYIYSITNKKTGHIYIGQSNNPERRFHSHKRAVSGGSRTKIHNAMRSYGIDCFFVSVLASAETRKIINILEKQYILIYDTIKSGYNICPGGEGISSEMASAIFNRKDVREKTAKRIKELWKNKEFREKKIDSQKKYWTEEKRKEASIRGKNLWDDERITKQKNVVNNLWKDSEYIKKQSDAKKRHWATPEYRQKMTEISKNKSNPVFLKQLAINNWKEPERAKRMSQGRISGRISVICLETLKKYDCLSEAQRDTGIKRRCISMNVSGETFRAGKLHWMKYCGEITKKEADEKIIALEQKRKDKLKEVWRKRKECQK